MTFVGAEKFSEIYITLHKVVVKFLCLQRFDWRRYLHRSYLWWRNGRCGWRCLWTAHRLPPKGRSLLFISLLLLNSLWEPWVHLKFSVSFGIVMFTCLLHRHRWWVAVADCDCGRAMLKRRVQHWWWRWDVILMMMKWWWCWWWWWGW